MSPKSDPVTRLLAAASRAPRCAATADEMPAGFDSDVLRQLRLGRSEPSEAAFVLPVFRHAFAWACAVLVAAALISGYHLWNAPNNDIEAIDEAIIAASAIELSLVP